MADPLSVSAIIISGITAVGAIITGLHIKHMNSGCCECDCVPGTPRLARSPTVTKPPVVLQPIKTSSDV